MMKCHLKLNLCNRIHKLWRLNNTIANTFNSTRLPAVIQTFASVGRENVGLFGCPELTSASGFAELQQQTDRKIDMLVNEATSKTRERKLVLVFDDISDTLCRVEAMSYVIRVAHTKRAFAEAAESTYIHLSKLIAKLSTNVSIYNALREVSSHGDHVTWDDVDTYTAQRFVFQFENSEIHLSEAQRQQFNELCNANQLFGEQFEHGCCAPVTEKKENVPLDLRQRFVWGDRITITGLQSECRSEAVREAAYRIYHSRHEQQEAILEELFATRHQLAHLVGFPSFAHMAVRGSLAETPEKINDFLHTLADRIKSRVQKEYDFMALLKRRDGTRNPVMPWDTDHYGSSLNKCGVELGKLGVGVLDYFSLGTCMQGLDVVCSSLFGVRLRVEDPQHGEIWATDIFKLAVEEENGSLLGHIYLDVFERQNKPVQECYFTVRDGRQLPNGEYQNPVGVLMLNLSRPRGWGPCLLYPHKVVALFHEFGHALHFMLGRTRYQRCAKCVPDFVEVPSLFMEYFASDPRVVREFARHWKTGEMIPDKILQAFCRSQRHISAFVIQQQIIAALIDQAAHSPQTVQKCSTDLLADIHSQHHGLPLVPGTAWHLRFSYFGKYGANVYCYLLCRAVASKLWHQRFDKDPLSRSAGELFRSKVLAPGGGKHPKHILADILGEEQSLNCLVDTLLEDLEDSDYIKNEFIGVDAFSKFST